MPMLDATGAPVHFSLPFRRDAVTGKVVCDVQDSPANLNTQVTAVVNYPVGYRPEKPGFGIPWPYGETAPIDGDPIQAAVEQQVPNVTGSWTEYAADTVMDRILQLNEGTR